MRVAVVSMYTPDHRESRALRRTRRVAEGLADRDHDVTWLCAQWWGGETREFERRGDRYRRATSSPSEGSFRSKLPFALRRVDPAVVHAVVVPPGPAITAKTAGRFLRVPVVVDWWDATDGEDNHREDGVDPLAPGKRRDREPEPRLERFAVDKHRNREQRRDEKAPPEQLLVAFVHAAVTLVGTVVVPTVLVCRLLVERRPAALDDIGCVRGQLLFYL
jgi:hypothetical protein